MRIKSMMHKDFEIDDHVAFDTGGPEGLKGTGIIIGVASNYVLNTYIILLDIPIQVPDYEKPWRAIAVSGTLLKSL